MGLITLVALALIWLTVSPDGRTPMIDGRPLIDAPVASPARR